MARPVRGARGGESGLGWVATARLSRPRSVTHVSSAGHAPALARHRPDYDTLGDGVGITALLAPPPPLVARRACLSGVVGGHSPVALLLVRRQAVPAPPRLEGEGPDSTDGAARANQPRHQRSCRWSTNSTIRCESWITSSPCTSTGAQRW